MSTKVTHCSRYGRFGTKPTLGAMTPGKARNVIECYCANSQTDDAPRHSAMLVEKLQFFTKQGAVSPCADLFEQIANAASMVAPVSALQLDQKGSSGMAQMMEQIESAMHAGVQDSTRPLAPLVQLKKAFTDAQKIEKYKARGVTAQPTARR